MKLTLASSPSKTLKRDRFQRHDLAVAKKRFKIAAISATVLLICSVTVNLLYYFHKI